MAYVHGIKVSEVPTSVLPPVTATAGIPFIVGTAPKGPVNEPVLCYSYAELVETFGYVPPVEDEETGLKKFEFSISEFANSQFSLFGVAPVIVVNVLDPETHIEKGKQKDVPCRNGEESSVVIPDSANFARIFDIALDGSFEEMIPESEYELARDADGNWVINITNQVDVFNNVIYFYYDKLKPTSVTAEDVIGGVDGDGKKSGLELINECFPRFRLVPGLILAPGFSGDPAVAAVMAAKADNINEHFTATALIDVPTDTVKKYSDVAEWKNTNNVVDPRQIACWPMLSLGGTLYHQSTQLAGLIGKVDAENGDVPYVSPSNKNYQMTASVLADGTEVWLSPDVAAYLNGQGVVTALNFMGGWKCWGNRTACYPTVTDVKDAFIPIRRMFDWIGNSLVQTYWQKLDAPLNNRQIDTIVDSVNIWLNGLVAQECLLGGEIRFLEEENPVTDLMDGIARFHVYITPPSPNREIDFILEYDVANIEKLFA